MNRKLLCGSLYCIYVLFLLILYHHKDTFLYFPGCEVGYYGYNCTDPCRYPSFGYRCQNVCNCTQDMCDHKTGCSLPQSKIKETNI